MRERERLRQRRLKKDPNNDQGSCPMRSIHSLSLPPSLSLCLFSFFFLAAFVSFHDVVRETGRCAATNKEADEPDGGVRGLLLSDRLCIIHLWRPSLSSFFLSLLPLISCASVHVLRRSDFGECFAVRTRRRKKGGMACLHFLSFLLLSSPLDFFTSSSLSCRALGLILSTMLHFLFLDVSHLQLSLLRCL